MKRFKCDCDTAVFFGATTCLLCGGILGFDPARLDIVRIAGSKNDIWTDVNGVRFRRCSNGITYDNCNWLIPEHDPDVFCVSCRLNRTIPNLEERENVRLWSRIEAAKQRLVYSLLALGLPVNSKVRGWPLGLAFDFVEDQRSNPDVAEEFVLTGHEDGVITLNIHEADDVVRVRARESMNERYRTVLGHTRHESGHYYFEHLVAVGPALGEFRALFGDERQDYAAALERFYNDGPPADWHDRHITAYAASHPHEDWAETWAHYLHITDGLETAVAFGLCKPVARDIDKVLTGWSEFSIALNEIMRGLGLPDAYPFVISPLAADKLRFVDRIIRTASNRPRHRA
jgi:hypothetical protein